MFRLSRRGLAAAVAVGLLAGPAAAEKPKIPTLGTIERLDKGLDAVLGEDAVIELLVDHKFDWSEGPVWDKANRRVLFSDIPKNMVWQWSAEGGLKEFLKPSGYTGTATFTGKEPGSNGLAFNKAGELLVGTLSNGPLYKLTIEGGNEKSRAMLGAFRGWTEAIALDEDGRIYLSTHGASGVESQLIRLEPDGSGPVPLTTGPAFRGLAFGRGALDCRDLYVASQTGPLRRITTQSYGLPVP